MNKTMRRRSPIGAPLSAALLAAWTGGALGQDAATPAPGGLAAAPSPYYLGANQSFTHDSNVYRVPFGPSDNYSSTSLLAGFDQPFSRQRLFGTATVSLNRYQEQTALNNTSYGLLTGIDWATIWKLSGNVTATLNQSLAAPAATVAAPSETRNVLKRKGLSGLARWGGESVLSAEGRLGYSTQDYSGAQYNAANTKNEYGSLGVFYHPGPRLQLGVAARLDRTRAPFAFQLADGTFQGNETRGRNLDFLADYNNGNSLTASGRLSYTRQTNTSVDTADFSGLTGSLNLGYRATGKIAFNLAASRDAGFNATRSAYTLVMVAPTPVTTGPVSTTAALYENNQVTNAVSAGVTYAATSKIGLTAGARYSRARIITSPGGVTSGSPASSNVTDTSRGANLVVNYAFSRAWTFACSLARERREVAGAFSYGYTDDVAACSAQFLWR